MAKNAPKFPYDIEDIANPLYEMKLVKVGPKRFVYPSAYRVLGPQYYNFKIRASDVFLIGFPRSGTTWTQEAVWLINNNLDYNSAKSITCAVRVPHLDVGLVSNYLTEWAETISNDVKMDVEVNLASPLEKLSNQPSPRYIKTHMPLSLLPPNLLDTAKVVYIARDPRDVAVSLYMLMKLKHLEGVDFKTFWKAFSEGKVYWSPQMEHITEAWSLRSHPNILFLTYEDMYKDLPSCLRCMSEFFGKNYTDDQIQGLCDYLNFKNFRKNPAVNYESTFKTIGMVDDGEHSFIRKGKAGAWRKYFDEELKSQAEKWLAEKLADTDLPFTL